MRRAAKRDLVENDIVNALHDAGWMVWTTLPCDLLCYRAGQWRVLECKSPANKANKPRLDKRQARQAEFIAATNTPVVVTPEQALAAIGGIAL